MNQSFPKAAAACLAVLVLGCAEQVPPQGARRAAPSVDSLPAEPTTSSAANPDDIAQQPADELTLDTAVVDGMEGFETARERMRPEFYSQFQNLKSYTPSDNQRVANELAGMLADAHLEGCRRIEIEVKDGHVAIGGETISADVKAAILELLQEHPSIDTVEDRLTINPSLWD